MNTTVQPVSATSSILPARLLPFSALSVCQGSISTVIDTKFPHRIDSSSTLVAKAKMSYSATLTRPGNMLLVYGTDWPNISGLYNRSNGKGLTC